MKLIPATVPSPTFIEFETSAWLVPVIVAVASVVCGMLWVRHRRLLLAFAKLERDRCDLNAEIDRLQVIASERAKADAANEAKSRFLATVTHEIRTPLNGILGVADLLGGTPITREQQAYVQAIRSSGTALTLLIDEILDLSRIEAGKLDLTSEPFDLVELVERTAELMAPRAHGKHLDLTVAIQPGTPQRVVGDALRLGQVLTNLLSNAVKFTETGGIELRLSLQGNERILFQVSDTGIGVPMDRQVAIFEAYEQATNGLGQTDEGTGLGLAISKQIVAAMDGVLGLSDRPGGGSMFFFDVGLPSALSRQNDTLARPRHGGGAGLVVSQAPFLPNVLGGALEIVGLRSVIAADEADAQSFIADGGPYDVVLIDCAGGEAVTQGLVRRARAAGHRRVLLVFSALERRQFGQKLAEEADGWLVKPVRRASLRERLAPAATALPKRPLPGSAPHVLIAEDDDVNALVSRAVLERAGARVHRTGDGRSALEAFDAAGQENRPYDVVLLDLRMPGPDGFEVARRIRSGERARPGAAARLIAVSATVDEDIRRRCRQAGFDEVVQKPIRADVLVTPSRIDRASA